MLRSPWLPVLLRLSGCLLLLTGIAAAQPSYTGELLPELAGGASRVHGMTGDGWIKPVLAGEVKIDTATWRACVHEWDWDAKAYTVTALPVLAEARDSRVNAIDRDFRVAPPRGRLLAAGVAGDADGVPRPIVWIKVGAGDWSLEQLPVLAGLGGECRDVRIRGEEPDEIYRACGWVTDGDGVRKAALWERPVEAGAWILTLLPDNGALRRASAGLVGEEGDDLVGEEGDDIVAAGQVEDLSGAMVPVVWKRSIADLLFLLLPLLEGGQTGEPLAMGTGFTGGDVGPAPLVAGWSEVAGGAHRPVRWSLDGSVWSISELPIPAGSSGAEVNDFGGGDVGPAPLYTGVASDPLGARKALIWWREDLTYIVEFLEDLVVNDILDMDAGDALDSMGRIGAHGSLTGAKALPGHAVLAVPVPAPPTVLYVDPSATGPAHDGLTWCTAYLRLSEALAVAIPGATIKVADGLQRPDTTGLADPRDATFQLRDDVTIAGGHAGCGAVWPDRRDPMVFKTVLSGDLLGNDLTAGGTAENCYHVLVASGTGPTAVLDGVVVTAGNANGTTAGTRDHGGGMLNGGGSPTINDCVFLRNSATTTGGGISNRVYASPTVTGCVFRANTANGGGGMMNFAASNPVVTRCEFIGNSAGGGGGILNDGANPWLIDCLFADNRAGMGGGLRNFVSGTVVAINCAFYGNSATSTGGAVSNRGGAQTFTNCLFTGNDAANGGAMVNDAFANPVLTGCTISGNTATGSGGGLFQTNLTGGSPLVRNSILWGNGDSGGMDESAQIHTMTGTPVVDWSCVMGGWSGAGASNIDLDPQFEDPDGADGLFGTLDDKLDLTAGSPCIDSGNDSLVTLDLADLDGDLDVTERTPVDLGFGARFLDDPGVPDSGVPDPPLYLEIVDRGCLEFAGSTPPPTVVAVFPELGGGQSAADGAVVVGVQPYVVGWSLDEVGIRRPVLWREEGAGWEILQLPDGGHGGRVADGFSDPATDTVFLCGATAVDTDRLMPKPTFWTVEPDSPPVLTVLPLPVPGGQGFLADGRRDGPTTLCFYGWATDADGRKVPVEWVLEEGQPPVLNVLITVAPGGCDSFLEDTTGTLPEIAGWVTDAAGEPRPVLWSRDAEQGGEWFLLELETLGGAGRGNGVVIFEPPQVCVVGHVVDGDGDAVAALWREDGIGGMALELLPAPAGHASSVALSGRIRGDGALVIVGEAFDTDLEAQAIVWVHDPQKGSWTVGNLDDLAGGALRLGTAVCSYANVGDAVYFGTGFLSGAAKSIAEPHAFALIASALTGVEAGEDGGPPALRSAMEVHPNPFNPEIRIAFELPEAGRASLAVYDLKGRRVAVLVDGRLERGRHSLGWDGRGDGGRRLGSGVYLLRLESAQGAATRKVSLVR